ncbi:MAG TPA: cation transporter [Methanothrix sp.]|nr:cation transporter [Methanothrix sp.]HPJ84234.1 cation transporter [Methanothrix sp.]HPR67191.1 cation transporter [Methanothrix sp.]
MEARDPIETDASDEPYKKALRLEYFTLAYNVAEAAASIVFGSMAGSIALIGFGMDSIVESLSGLILIWRLKKHRAGSEEEEEKIEKRAERFVAVTFFLLGSYILFESAGKLVEGEVPEPSIPGIAIALLSMTIMPILARKKYDLGVAIKSRALIADSKETLACALLSVALLLGLGANYLFGLWQADPIVGLLIVAFLYKEGLEGWKESSE